MRALVSSVWAYVVGAAGRFVGVVVPFSAGEPREDRENSRMIC